jgi:hypothetical protein
MSYPGGTAQISPRPDAVEGAGAARFLLSGRLTTSHDTTARPVGAGVRIRIGRSPS